MLLACRVWGLRLVFYIVFLRFSVDFSIVLLGYPLQTVHEKAWLFMVCQQFSLGTPYQIVLKKRKFSRKKRWRNKVFSVDFSIVLLGYPPTNSA